VAGLVLRHTGNASDPRLSDGFAVVEALYAEVALRSAAEERRAEEASMAAVAASAATRNFGATDGEGGRERAAAAREVAERDARSANEAYEAVLLRRRGDDRAAREAEAEGRKLTMGRASGLKSSPPPEGTKAVPVSVTFANNYGERVRVGWVDFRGKELAYCHLDREESRTIASFFGHCWVVRSVATEEIAHAGRCSKLPKQVMWVGGEIKIGP
jgi:hypothetical protein